MNKLLEKLREPFAREELEFRVGAVNKDKMEGLALAYVQARAIQNRLDEAFDVALSSFEELLYGSMDKKGLIDLIEGKEEE